MPKTWYCAAPSARRAGDSAFNPCSSALRAAAFALLAALGLSSTARAQYCAAGSATCGTAFDDERISHVTFAGIDNDSGTGDGPAGCYTDFTAIIGTVQLGGTYPITVINAGVYAPDQSAVWIDWNHDLTFGDVASGEQTTLTSTDGGATFTGTVTVPAGATLGNTRMRVRVMYTGTVSPCDNATYGEVEDYTINTILATQGACCNFSTGACSTTTSAGCVGSFQGNATSCTPSNPCGGACCTGTTCSVTIAATCPSGSLYISHGVCNTTACQYCTAGSATCGTAFDDERISHFTFNTIDNDSGAGDGPAGCYTDFTSISTNVYPGQTYAVTLTNAGVYAADQAAVWIDWNRDVVFDVATEQVVLTSADGGATFAGSVTVPAGAAIGSTRLRARVCYTTGLTPCGNAAFGEVEDYTVNVLVATNGACCQASGACTETLPGACSGTFNGVATSCAPTNPCGGACCNTAGACSVTTAATCPSASVFQNGRPCSATVCNGSCCDANGVCTLANSAGGCVGAFAGAGSTCTTNPCPPPPNDECANAIPLIVGAAPVTGTTLNSSASYATNPAWCAASTLDVYWRFVAPAAGNYGISMTNTVATSVIVLANCGDTTAIACSGTVANNGIALFPVPAAGTYYIRNAGFTGAGGQGTFSIEVHTVTAGACCNDTTGACTLVANATCAAGATYQGDNTACSATLCGQGACCNPATGVCTLSTLGGCTGQFQSVGTVCTPTNPCPQPPTGACCNSTTGACTQVFAVNCSATTSTYNGDNSSCPVGGFCPGSGTCCSPLGNCVIVYAGAACPGGLTSNTSTSCTAGLCPASGPATCENFDSGAVGSLPNNWTSTSSAAGAPWAIVDGQSHSPSNAVFTNDVGTVSAQFLQLPAVTAGGNLSLEFWSYFDTETNWDGWVVEYSTDAGGTWTDVGTAGFSLNGYNNAALNVSGNPLTGRPAFSGVFTIWTLHIASIPATAGQSVIVRFQVASDASVSHVGVWLDDICIGGIQSAAGGVCCRGSTCSTSFATAAACAAAVNSTSATVLSKFVPALAACNTPVTIPGTLGNTTSPCCYANYNHNASIEVQDIFDFINDWLAGKKAAIVGGNGTTGTLDVQNIFDFINAWLAGGCS